MNMEDRWGRDDGAQTATWPGCGRVQIVSVGWSWGSPAYGRVRGRRLGVRIGGICSTEIREMTTWGSPDCARRRSAMSGWSSGTPEQRVRQLVDAFVDATKLCAAGDRRRSENDDMVQALGPDPWAADGHDTIVLPATCSRRLLV
jgi:hypothetical protein